MSESSQDTRRWYDNDPVLSKAIKIMETSDDGLQIQIALNLIKVIIEHNIENEIYSSVEDIMESISDEQEVGGSRWYDIDETIRTAIQLLRNCSPETQNKLAQDIAVIVTESLNKIDEEN